MGSFYSSAEKQETEAAVIEVPRDTDSILDQLRDDFKDGLISKSALQRFLQDLDELPFLMRKVIEEQHALVDYPLDVLNTILCFNKFRVCSHNAEGAVDAHLIMMGHVVPHQPTITFLKDCVEGGWPHMFSQVDAMTFPLSNERGHGQTVLSRDVPTVRWLLNLICSLLKCTVVCRRHATDTAELARSRWSTRRRGVGPTSANGLDSGTLRRPARS